jgi:hypothetical protein
VKVNDDNRTLDVFNNHCEWKEVEGQEKITHASEEWPERHPRDAFGDQKGRVMSEGIEQIKPARCR